MTHGFPLCQFGAGRSSFPLETLLPMNHERYWYEANLLQHRRSAIRDSFEALGRRSLKLGILRRLAHGNAQGGTWKQDSCRDRGSAKSLGETFGRRT